MLLVVILISIVFRFYSLASIPPALDWDEASTAYNAYSILKTGRDEFGASFPIVFRAFNAYVPPVLVYLNSASVAVFGLSEFAARFPNAFLGTLLVLGVYLLVFEISRRRDLALFSAFVLAISPWHITYSRVNFFATVPVFFITFATYFFFLSFKKKLFLYLAILFFVLAIFSYFSAYVFVPLFCIGLAFLYRKEFKLHELGFLVFPVLFSTFVLMFILPGGQIRAKGVSSLSDPDLIKTTIQEGVNEGFLGKVIHNRRLVYAQSVAEGYFSDFRFDFLFGKADAVSRMQIGGYLFGLLYFWDLPFLLFGIYFLVRYKPKFWKLLLFWLLIAPIPSAATFPQNSSTRFTVAMPAIQIIVAYGFLTFVKNRSRFTKAVIILALFFNFFLFAHQYFRHFEAEQSKFWFYGYKQLFAYLDKENVRDREVYFVFRQEDPLNEVHAFLLFYNKIDPASWQAAGGTRMGCVGTTGQFSYKRYHFYPISCPGASFDSYKVNGEDLVVVSFDLGPVALSKISYLDGNTAFYVYKLFDVRNKIGVFGLD